MSGVPHRQESVHQASTATGSAHQHNGNAIYYINVGDLMQFNSRRKQPTERGNMADEPKEPADWPGERKGIAKACEEVDQLEAAEKSTLRLQTAQFLLVINDQRMLQPQRTPQQQTQSLNRRRRPRRRRNPSNPSKSPQSHQISHSRHTLQPQRELRPRRTQHLSQPEPR